MQITIHHDPTRSVVLQALWNHAADAVGEEQFRDDLYDCSWERISRVYGAGREGTDPFAAVAVTFETLDAVRAAVERVTAAEIGSSVDVPLDVSPLQEALSSCKDWILDRDGGFAGLSSSEQRHALDYRDAAVRLLAELAPAEAVA